MEWSHFISRLFEETEPSHDIRGDMRHVRVAVVNLFHDIDNRFIVKNSHFRFRSQIPKTEKWVLRVPWARYVVLSRGKIWRSA